MKSTNSITFREKEPFKVQLQEMEEGKKRYAVLAGCNYPGIDNYLDGAVTDVLKMRQVLVSRFGFEPGNIALLVDADIPESYKTEMDVFKPSTRMQKGRFSVDYSGPVYSFVIPGPPMKSTGKNIKDMLRHIVARAEPGDVLYFHFSGHGVQVPADEGRTKSAIVPCDFNLITDVDLRQIVNRMAKGASFTYLSDSCKTSGDLIDKTKEQLGEPTAETPSPRPSPNADLRIRTIPYEVVFNHLAAKSNIQSLNINDHLAAIFGSEEYPSNWRLPEKDMFADPLPLDTGILLTGCQPDSQSVDVHPDLTVGRLEGYGVFCNSVQKLFREHPDRKFTNKELVSLTRADLDGMQYPCLYCSDENVEKPFLYQP